MMKKHPSIWLATSACAFLIAPCLADTPANGHSVGLAESAHELAGAMGAKGPHPSLGDQAQVFGRLVGSWDVDYMDVMKDGRRLKRTGLFIVGWVMDGRAIQDLWVVDTSQGHAEREVYTDVHYFDPKTLSWPSIFVDPEHASMSRFSGGAVADGRIVFQTSDLGTQQTRWSFEDIEPNSFIFRDEALGADGKSWKLQAEYHMKRRSAATLP